MQVNRWHFVVLMFWTAGVQFMVGGLVVISLSETRWQTGVVLLAAGLIFLFFVGRALDRVKKGAEE